MISQHRLQLRSVGRQIAWAAKELRKQDLQESDRGSRRRVGGNCVDVLDGLLTDQRNRAHPVFCGNGNIGQNYQSGDLGVGESRDDADVGLVCGQRRGTLGGYGVGDFEVAAGITVLEVPHERCRVEKGNGRDT